MALCCIVGNPYCCPSVVEELPDVVLNRFGVRRIESGRWFIKQQNPWSTAHRPYQGQSLLLSGRQSGNRPIPAIGRQAQGLDLRHGFGPIIKVL